MNLDDIAQFRVLDTQNIIASINGLPEQLLAAWELGQALALPGDLQNVRQVIIVGMGASAIGADLAAAFVGKLCPLPVVMHRDYELPAWVRGPETLVVACSHSGATEETFAAFSQGQSRGCRTLALTTGGRLAQMDSANGSWVWRFQDSGQPRAADGTPFGLLLALFHRLRWIPDPYPDLLKTLNAMHNQQTNLVPEVPAVLNPAKRMAGQLLDRWAVIFAADDFLPVARRWKDQISTIAKAWGQFEGLPEVDHTSLAGLNHPESALSQMMALFLTAPSNHPRNLQRLDLTRKMFMVQGINTDFIAAAGENRMAHLWTLVHFGDYVAYYLAMAYGEDPSLIEAISILEAELDDLR